MPLLIFAMSYLLQHFRSFGFELAECALAFAFDSVVVEDWAVAAVLVLADDLGVFGQLREVSWTLFAIWIHLGFIIPNVEATFMWIYITGVWFAWQLFGHVHSAKPFVNLIGVRIEIGFSRSKILSTSMMILRLRLLLRLHDQLKILFLPGQPLLRHNYVRIICQFHGDIIWMELLVGVSTLIFLRDHIVGTQLAVGCFASTGSRGRFIDQKMHWGILVEVGAC